MSPTAASCSRGQCIYFSEKKQKEKNGYKEAQEGDQSAQ